MTAVGAGGVTIYAGPFHPDLETSLYAHLKGLAASAAGKGSLPSFAVVTPSREMRRHLKRLITLQWGMTLAGAHLLTAFHLSQRIARVCGGETPLKKADDLILVELVRDLVLQENFPAEWKRLARTAGGAGALHRSLRDLEEARLPLDMGDSQPLLRLHTRYQERRRELGLGTNSDPVEEAIRCSGDSKFLRSLEHVVYDGFYDMTELQVNLLAQVSSICPTTVFLPCVPGHRAYGFANDFLGVLKRRFPEAEVRPATGGQRRAEDRGRHFESGDLRGERALLQPVLDRLFSDEAVSSPVSFDRGSLRSFTVSGPEAELEVAAKEILRWTEEEGFGFHEIGVIARNLAPYLPSLSAVFDAHAIPFRTPETRPLSRLPWAKALSSLNRVLADDFPRGDVFELLASPFFSGGDGDAPIGETARRLARRINVVCGIRDWEKVAGLPAEEIARGDGDGDLPPLSLEEVRRVQNRLAVVIEAAREFPDRCSWREATEAYRRLVQKILPPTAVPDEGTPAVDSPKGPSDHLEDILENLEDRGKIQKETNSATFFSALGDHLRSCPVPLRDAGHAAVEVASAMDARGKGFACLVVMGLQEGVWPWRSGEDPFLNDAAREELSEAQGVRLLKKSAGHEEERLLFTLALASARQHVALTWQRSGEDGKPLVRSWYVHELARAIGRIDGTLPDTVHVPRRLEDRFREKINPGPFWTPSEWTARLLLSGQDPERLQAVRGLGPGVLQKLFETGTHLKHTGQSLTDRDGITGKLPRLWKDLQDKGWSPTALETYAQCPFKFFARHVLRLKELEAMEEVTELEAAEVGTLLHEIFQRFFARWDQKETGEANRILSDLIESTLSGYESNRPIGYPLLWERTRRTIQTLAERYTEQELRHLEQTGFHPIAFEKKAEAILSGDPKLPSIVRRMKIRGRLDRIDQKTYEDGTVALRVVDYKYKGGASDKNFDRKLPRATLRASSLQPSFYVFLAQAGTPNSKANAELHYLAPHWPEETSRKDEFPSGTWEDPLWADEAWDTLGRILKGVRDGEFFIIPHDGDYGYCRHCPYQGICRKNHRPTRYRRKADPRTNQIEELSEKKWPPKS